MKILWFNLILSLTSMQSLTVFSSSGKNRAYTQFMKKIRQSISLAYNIFWSQQPQIKIYNQIILWIIIYFHVYMTTLQIKWK